MLATLFPVMWPRSSLLRQWHVCGRYAGDAALALFPSLSSGPDAPHHGRYEPEEQLRSDTVWIIVGDSFWECFVFSAMLGSTVDTVFRQSTRRSRRLRSTRKLRVFLGDDFRIVSVFSAELGSIADTCTASVHGAF